MIGQEAGKSFAYILGVYLGDGCVTEAQLQKYGRSNRMLFRLNTIDEDFARTTKAALEKLSGYTVTLSKYAVAKSDKPNWALSFGDRAICNRLVADTKSKSVIPDYVFHYSRGLKLAFIAGLMDSEGFVAGNKNHTGRRYYMGFKSCDPWVRDFIRVLNSVGIIVGKVSQEQPRKPGYKIPTRFTIKMQSWVNSGARFNIARKQRRVDEWAATPPDPRGLRFNAKLTPETTCRAPAPAG